MHSRQQREYKNCTYNAYITRLSAISPIAMKAHRVSRLHARQRNLQRRLRNSKASRAKDLPAASGTKLRRMWEQRRFSRKLLFPPPLSLSLSLHPRREQDVADVIFQRHIKLIISPESYGSDMTDGQTGIRSFRKFPPGARDKARLKTFQI